MKRSDNPFLRVLRREAERMTSRRLYFGVCIVLPLFCAVFMNTIFGDGMMERIPVGIVDLDETATSRSIARAVAALPTTRVTQRFADAPAARQALRSKRIYAYVTIPRDFESDLLGGRPAVLPYYYHYALLSVGTEIHAALESLLATAGAAPLAEAGEAVGTSEARMESILLPVAMQAHPIGNPALDYAVYLSDPFFFVLLQVLVLLVTAYALGSEIKFGTAREWLAAADGNIFVAVTAKLLPYTAIFVAMGLLGNYLAFGPGHIPHGAGFLALDLYAALFFVATQALGVLLFALFPVLSLAISVVSMTGSLGATLAGITFPVENMYRPVYLLSFLFPIRHFALIDRTLLYGGGGFADCWPHVAALLLFPAAALLPLVHLKRAVLSGRYERIE